MRTCIYVTTRNWQISMMIMDEYQYIKNIEHFYHYVTNTWRDDSALFYSVLWNYYDFKTLRTNNHIEGGHHRLNNDLNNVVYPHFYLFIRAIQNNYAYNSAASSRHLATGILPLRKKLFVNRDGRLYNLEERFKQQTLTLDEYLENVMRLMRIKKYSFFFCSIFIFSSNYFLFLYLTLLYNKYFLTNVSTSN